MTKQKTKKEIIDETAYIYAEDTDRRGISDSNRCVYKTDDGKMCAVGRCIDPKNEWAENAYESKGDASDFLSEFKDSIFKPQYQGHEERFWFDLQEFHDKEANFHVELHQGLTEEGEKKLNILHDKWDNA